MRVWLGERSGIEHRSGNYGHRIRRFSHCGAPLAIPAGVQFVSCNRCQAMLVVRREASITLTSEIADGVVVPDVANDLERLKIEQELARIDREWQMQREDLMVSGRPGHRYRPSVAGGVILIVLTLVFGGMGILIASVLAYGFGGAAVIGPLMTSLFLLGGLLIGANMIAKARRWSVEEGKYLQRRAEVERRLD